MKLLKRIRYNQLWNIGFCEQSISEVFQEYSLRKIRWLKHPYRDRWFADPFLLDVNDDTIIIFVEERLIEGDKGYLSELLIERKTLKLLERKVILEQESHLSYPAIVRFENSVYVYPENALGGALKIYSYDPTNHCLVNPRIILDESVADATIFNYGGHFYIIATKYPNSQEDAFLYKADKIDGPYKQVSSLPIQNDRSCSRPAGNLFTYNGVLFRPAQDCSKNYGGGLSIMMINNLSPYDEQLILKVKPESVRYNLGIHTFNCSDNLIVVDGCGYLSPLLGRVYYSRFIRKVGSIIKMSNSLKL